MLLQDRGPELCSLAWALLGGLLAQEVLLGAWLLPAAEQELCCLAWGLTGLLGACPAHQQLHMLKKVVRCEDRQAAQVESSCSLGAELQPERSVGLRSCLAVRYVQAWLTILDKTPAALSRCHVLPAAMLLPARYSLAHLGQLLKGRPSCEEGKVLCWRPALCCTQGVCARDPADMSRPQLWRLLRSLQAASNASPSEGSWAGLLQRW